MTNEEIKKYPVFYNGEEYEIRIEQPYYIAYYYNKTEYVTIYKVIKRKTLFGRTKIEYEKVYEKTKESLIFNYTIDDDDGNEIMIKSKDIDIGSDTYYIQLFKKAFNLYKDKLKREKEIEEEQERKIVALQEWDGIIE